MADRSSRTRRLLSVLSVLSLMGVYFAILVAGTAFESARRIVLAAVTRGEAIVRRVWPRRSTP